MKSDPGAEQQGLAQVVSDEDDGFSQAFLQRQKFALQFGASDGIERAERLVHEQKLGVGRQGAGHADSLPLSAREFTRVARRQLRFKAHQLQQFSDPVSGCGRQTILRSAAPLRYCARP